MLAHRTSGHYGVIRASSFTIDDVKLKPGEQTDSSTLEDVDVLDEDEKVIRCAACGARVLPAGLERSAVGRCR